MDKPEAKELKNIKFFDTWDDVPEGEVAWKVDYKMAPPPQMSKYVATAPLNLTVVPYDEDMAITQAKKDAAYHKQLDAFLKFQTQAIDAQFEGFANLNPCVDAQAVEHPKTIAPKHYYANQFIKKLKKQVDVEEVRDYTVTLSSVAEFTIHATSEEDAIKQARALADAVGYTPEWEVEYVD